MGGLKRYLVHNDDGTHRYVMASSAAEALGSASEEEPEATTSGSSDGGGADGFDITSSAKVLLEYVNAVEGEERAARIAAVREAEAATGNERKGLASGLATAEAGV